jgi:hypothetical protein
MEVDMGKEPSALIPVVMSLGALIVAIVAVALQLGTRGVEPARDAGAIAHLWQLLMVAQLPVIAYFAFRWLCRTPWQAATVLIVQALAWAAAAVLPVLALRWW